MLFQVDGTTGTAAATAWVVVEAMITEAVEEAGRRVEPALPGILGRGWAMTAAIPGETIGEGSVGVRVLRTPSTIRISGHGVSNDGGLFSQR